MGTTGYGGRMAIDDIAITSNTATTLTTRNATLTTLDEQQVNTLMYPNPATNFLNVQMSKGTQSLEVYSVGGAVMQNVQVTEQGVDVSRLPSGMYLLVITTEEGIIREKFSKQ
ncbi:MAG: T9SS type A sorting domain-containing protein [Thermonemataceae bacterium]